jgi:hypothetical protein
MINLTVQQPISDNGFSLPQITGVVNIINSGDVIDPVDPIYDDFNKIHSAEIWSQFGTDTDDWVTTMYDIDLTTTYSASCEGDFAQLNIQFQEVIPLQTFGIKTELGYYGSIAAADEDGNIFSYCVEDVLLDGFHRCDVWTSRIVITKGCLEDDEQTFRVAELGAFLYAEAGSWDWIEYGQVDNTNVSLEGLFGNSQSTLGEEGFSYQGGEFFLSFNTPVPVVAWVTVPSPATSNEWLTTEIWETNTDWELQGYPYVGTENEYGEIMTQNITVHASDSSATRFLHKLGVFSSCNSFDESSWEFVDIGDSCEYTSDGEISCSYDEYDLAENNGVYWQDFPLIEMVQFHLSSASCFEIHYEIFNEDGSEYDGPLYIDEWDSLTLDNPYDYVDETLYARVEITMQQPISD